MSINKLLTSLTEVKPSFLSLYCQKHGLWVYLEALVSSGVGFCAGWYIRLHFLLNAAIQSDQPSLLKTLSFLPCLFWFLLFCKRSGVPRCMELCLVVSSVPPFSMSVLMLIARCFITLALSYNLGCGTLTPPTVLIIQGCCSYPGLFVLPYGVKVFFPVSVKNYVEILIGILLNL